MCIRDRGRSRKARGANANFLVKQLPQLDVALTVISANAVTVQAIQSLEGPVPAPNSARKSGGICRAANPAINDVIPSLAPHHKTGMVPDNLIKTGSQHNHVPT